MYMKENYFSKSCTCIFQILNFFKALNDRFWAHFFYRTSEKLVTFTTIKIIFCFNWEQTLVKQWVVLRYGRSNEGGVVGRGRKYSLLTFHRGMLNQSNPFLWGGSKMRRDRADHWPLAWAGYWRRKIWKQRKVDYFLTFVSNKHKM